jgi:hypothetical protein
MRPAPSGTSFADWATAVGTVGATILALFGIYRAAWSRPKLRMETHLGKAPNADHEENMSTSNFGPPLPSAWIRARVISRRGLATNAEVSIRKATVQDSSGTRPINIDGSSLCWSQQEPATAQLDIPPSLSRRIDIASVTQSPVGPTPLTLETLFKPNNRNHIVPRGRVTLDLAVASSNGPASYYTAVLEYDGTWPAGEQIWSHLRVVSLKRQQRLRSFLRA